MSHTLKDSRRNAKRELKVFRRDDGLFDVSYPEEKKRVGITERTLSELLCVGSGFCGEELAQIVRELGEKGY